MNACVTEGHEVSSPGADRTHQILEAIHATPHLSQRSLSVRLGIALGLTNSLMRGLIQRGWVRATRVQRHRFKYLLTPAGVVAKAKLSQAAFQNAVDRYRTVRTRVRDTFMTVSATWEWSDPMAPARRRKRVVFYGSGEVAEIGFICLQETDLELVAVIDDQGRSRFFGAPIFDGRDGRLALEHAGADVCLLVMSLAPTKDVERDLAVLGEAGRKAVWI